MDNANNQAPDKPIDFSASILSLSTTALLQFGVIENPRPTLTHASHGYHGAGTMKKKKDLEAAKGNIDALAELRLTYHKMNVEQGA